MIAPVQWRCPAYLAVLLCCMIVVEGRSQVREIPESLGTSRQDSVPDGVMPLDTPVMMTYVRMHDRTPRMLQDSLGWDDMRHDALPFGFAHLGNRGSAARSLLADHENPIGYHYGLFQYHPYFHQDTTMRFYTQVIPVLQATYSQAGQENTHLQLDFGRRFDSGVSLTFLYNRINQVGEFAHQHQKNTSFAIGVLHDAPNERYDAFYCLISNAAISQENGGIASIDDIDTILYNDETIPVRITNGLSSQKYRSFVTRQILHLTGDSASLGFDIWAKAAYHTSLYKYVDEQATVETDYYPASLLFDGRGIRQYTFDRAIDGTFGISLPWTKAHSTISAALHYRNMKVNQEPEQRTRNELYLEGEADFNWIEPLQLHGKVALGLGQADGNYTFEANGILQLGQVGALSGRWAIMSRKPYGVESKLYVNQQLIYAVDLKNPFRSDIEVRFKNEKHLLDGGIRWSVLDNYIYFDESAFPQQLSGSLSLQQFFVQKEFDFRWVGLTLKGVWQPETPDVLALPATLAQASLYGRINMFRRRLTAVPGIDITYYSEYRGISYFPVNGVYHLGGGQQIPAYTRIDAGIGARIKFLKVFIRMEDLVGLVEDRALYQANLYPHFQGYLRIGATAGFFN